MGEWAWVDKTGIALHVWSDLCTFRWKSFKFFFPIDRHINLFTQLSLPSFCLQQIHLPALPLTILLFQITLSNLTIHTHLSEHTYFRLTVFPIYNCPESRYSTKPRVTHSFKTVKSLFEQSQALFVRVRYFA